METPPEKIRELAEEHVDWFLHTVRPLLITFMVQGFKHGIESEKKRKGSIQQTEVKDE